MVTLRVVRHDREQLLAGARARSFRERRSASARYARRCRNEVQAEHDVAGGLGDRARPLARVDKPEDGTPLVVQHVEVACCPM